jgi:hypothetical protein
MVYLLDVFNVVVKTHRASHNKPRVRKVHLRKVMSVRRITNVSDQFFALRLDLSTLHKGGCLDYTGRDLGQYLTVSRQIAGV